MGLFDWLGGGPKYPPDFTEGRWIVTTDAAPPPYKGGRHLLGTQEEAGSYIGVACVSWGVQFMIVINGYQPTEACTDLVFSVGGVHLNQRGNSRRPGDPMMVVPEFWPIFDAIRGDSLATGRLSVQIPHAGVQTDFSLGGYAAAHANWEERAHAEHPESFSQ
jgi:hypothetical protein